MSAVYNWCAYRVQVFGSGSDTRATTLVIAFSSLGNGLIRPEFRGSLLPSAGGPVDFDVLFVMDPANSWYCQNPGCTWTGYAYYADELCKRIENGGYQRVLLLGDSMVCLFPSMRNVYLHCD